MNKQLDETINKMLKEIEESEEKEGFKWSNLEQVFEIINIQHSRITKAIEYIENELDEECGCVSGSDLPYYVIDKLLDILKGSDKE